MGTLGEEEGEGAAAEAWILELDLVVLAVVAEWIRVSLAEAFSLSYSSADVAEEEEAELEVGISEETTVVIV